MDAENDFYVYVYIDPRNFEEFYYGKGRGNRKFAHLFDTSDSKKVKRIKEIKDCNLEPIIKVIAAQLTEAEALLIETTLIWKLGNSLSNINEGLFLDKFRPHNSMHQELFGFDFMNGIYHVNVGESIHRCWEDCRKYGFLSGGHDKKFIDGMKLLKKGDIALAYISLNGSKGGYVGIGKVLDHAVIAADFKINGKFLNQLDLIQSGVMEDSNNPLLAEYPVPIDWIKTFEVENGKWEKNKKLFAHRSNVASMQNQQETIQFVIQSFGIDPYHYLKKEESVIS